MKQKYYADLPPKNKKSTKIDMVRLKKILKKLRPILEEELAEYEKVGKRPINMAY